MIEDSNVQLTAAMPLSGKLKSYVLDRAARLLDRHQHCFGTVLLHIYVKSVNSRVGCTANLFTDDGRYHAYVEDWDFKRAVDDAMSAVNGQVVKHFEKRSQKELLTV